MWEVTLIAKKLSEGENAYPYEDTITFVFDTALAMSNFIDTALKTTTNTVEVNIKYLEQKEGEQNE